MPAEVFTHFTLEAEEADALKLDSLNVSPSVFAEWMKHVKLVTHTMIAKYWPFMSKDAVMKAGTAHKRVIMTDLTTYGDLLLYWGNDGRDPEKESAEKLSERSLGWCSKKGCVSFVPLPYDAVKEADRFGWKYAQVFQTQDELTRIFGTEEAAKRVVAGCFNLSILTHEVIHQLHYPTPPQYEKTHQGS